MGVSRRYKLIIFVIVGIVLVLFLMLLVFANTIYFKECKSSFCFNYFMEGCHRTTYVYDYGNFSLEYKVLGREGESCLVEVLFLKGDENSQHLKGESMICDNPLGTARVIGYPYNNCHGLLKEGLNDLMISGLQKYIVQNIGEINEEVLA